MGIKDITSYKSLWRGYEYYEAKRVLKIKRINEIEFDAQVSNHENRVYDVHLNIKHPRKSTCNCPHAEGRVVVCKHKIAVYFSIFPEEAKEYIEEIEAYEKEEEERYQAHQELLHEEYNEVREYVNSLSVEELRERLIECIMSEISFEDDDFF